MGSRGVASASLLAAIAALASIAALSWRAAEESRGLSAADFRSVVIVTLAVGAAALAVRSGSRVALPRAFDAFGPGARAVLVRAQEEAIRLRHAFIGTEHILLGLLGDRGTAGRLLAERHVNVDQSRGRIGAIVGAGAPVVGEIHLTPRVKRVLERASDASRRLGGRTIETEHLLLGLIEEADGVRIVDTVTVWR